MDSKELRTPESPVENNLQVDDATVHDELMDHDIDSKSQVSEKREVTESETEVPPSYSQAELDDYPDGGLRAWLVVLGGLTGTFATFGYVNAWGVFQEYYQENVLTTTPPSTIAWIGSIEYSLIFIPGLITGRLFDMGYFKVLLAVSTLIVVAATVLIAECKEYWQFLLCQGFAVGLACGVIFGPMLGVIAHWFKRRRGVALALVAIGSSIGGTIFPITARNLIPLIGFKWTMRVLGLIQLVFLGVTNLTLARRLPPKEHLGPFINLAAFKNLAYSMYCASAVVAFLGLYTCLTYIDISATSVGIPGDFSFYLVSIANACSGVGRLASGILTDKFGAINVLAPATLIAAVLTYAWPFAKTKADYIVVAVIYGMASGAYVALLPAPIMAIGETHDVGLRVGMSMTLLAFGAVAGPPISGAINTATGGFEAVGYYAGSVVVLSVALMLATKYFALGTLRGKF